MNNSYKVLFLDIDGVFNRAEYGKDLYDDTYEDYCLALHRPSIDALRKMLVSNVDLKIVWISDWVKVHGDACESQHSYLNPLRALESFPWIKERVIGSITTTNALSIDGHEKIDAIKSYVVQHRITSYAIIDDYPYKVSCKDIEKHIVDVNPLKSFLEDDIERVEIALSNIIDSWLLKELFTSMDATTTFTINNRYECRFDYAQYKEKDSLFTEYVKDTNSPRLSATCNILVYDRQNNEHLLGMIALNNDPDLSRQHNASIYVKHLDSNNWESFSEVLWLSNIANCTHNIGDKGISIGD